MSKSIEEALNDFKEQNGFDFMDMINDEKTRKKHMFKQWQIEESNDNEFLEQNQFKQALFNKTK